MGLGVKEHYIPVHCTIVQEAHGVAMTYEL